MTTIKARATTLGGFLGAMWFVRVLDVLMPGYGSAAGHGVVPRTWDGLEGIPVAPFIHADFEHLVANTLPLLILGGLVLLRGVREFLFVVGTSALIGGVGTWLFGTGNSQHIGASGVVFGLFGYLLFRTAFDRRWSSALITAVPLRGKRSSSSPFARQTPSKEPNPSRCASAAFVMTPTVGCARLAR